ncbi:Ribosomal large subunit pseudouridine synthase C [hydrothermal vent metagenome]|uniref:Ribosomal large subunit pseudouridine synthase C n=1 Tax=hydrothermal vent metagenome TaxID=652676 RepID=A0A3B1AGX5_9ZZZZ
MNEWDNTRANFMVIDQQSSDQRIDNFLLRILKGAPRSLIYRILRSGEVRVNKGRIKPPYRLKEGDTVRIPPVRLSTKEPTSGPKKALCSDIENRIIFEDKHLLILNKPSGLAVHGGSGINHGVIEILRASRSKHDYLELAHRLDRDTSGTLIIAKNRAVLRKIHDLLKNNGVEKHYLALIQGKWPRKTKRIDAPLQKNVLSSGERIVKVNDAGKAALTIVRPLKLGQIASLVDVKIETGRTHQIRVHCAHEGHPIAGDNKYGDKRFDSEIKEFGLNRLFLHAFSLKFSLELESGTTLNIDITAPLDAKLESIIENLGIN